MGKLQRIDKPNDRCIYMVYPPIDTIQELHWEKGDEIDFRVENGRLIVERV